MKIHSWNHLSISRKKYLIIAPDVVAFFQTLGLRNLALQQCQGTFHEHMKTAVWSKVRWLFLRTCLHKYSFMFVIDVPVMRRKPLLVYFLHYHVNNIVLGYSSLVSCIIKYSSSPGFHTPVYPGTFFFSQDITFCLTILYNIFKFLQLWVSEEEVEIMKYKNWDPTSGN